MLLLQTSKKKVKLLEEILGKKEYFFPEDLANEINPDTGEKSILTTLNSQKTYTPVGKRIGIDYETFCVLKDANIINPNETYETGKPFDPIRGT